MIGVESDVGIRRNKSGELIPDAQIFFLKWHLEMMMAHMKMRYGVRNRENNPTDRQANRRKSLRLERASNSVDRNAETH